MITIPKYKQWAKIFHKYVLPSQLFLCNVYIPDEEKYREEGRSCRNGYYLGEIHFVTR